MQHSETRDRTRHTQGGRWARAGFAVLLVVCFLALWCGFTGSFSWQELLVGAVSSLLTAAFVGAMLHTSRLQARFAARDLLLAWRLPVDMARDCGVILRVFLRSFRTGEVPSHYRVCGFQASHHDLRKVGRSVLAIAYLSVSPNTVVIGIDPAQSLMLYHQLQPDEMTTVGRKLGAQA